MRPTWEDYSSANGFGYGRQVGPEDILAREVLVTKLNALPEFKEHKLLAFVFGEEHANNCRIVIVPNPDSVSTLEAKALWLANRVFAQNKRVSGMEEGHPLFEFQRLDVDGLPEWTINCLIDDAYNEMFASLSLMVNNATKLVTSLPSETEKTVVTMPDPPNILTLSDEEDENISF